MNDLTWTLAKLANEAGRRVGEAMRPHYQVRVTLFDGNTHSFEVQAIDQDRARAQALRLVAEKVPGAVAKSIVVNLLNHSHG